MCISKRTATHIPGSINLYIDDQRVLYFSLYFIFAYIRNYVRPTLFSYTRRFIFILFFAYLTDPELIHNCTYQFSVWFKSTKTKKNERSLNLSSKRYNMLYNMTVLQPSEVYGRRLRRRRRRQQQRQRCELQQTYCTYNVL